MADSLLPPAFQWAGPLLAPLYGLGVKTHRAFSSVKKAPLPVICIGNLTVGGTGKTPASKYFARGLVERGRKPAVLMRGYREQASDEAREVENAVKELGVPVLIGGDRYASALKAKEMGRDCVLLDDGFQHWRLARNIDIVLIDATNPFGGGHLIPRGRLREPVTGLERAGVVILTRSDQITSEELERLKKVLGTLAPKAVVARACHAPVSLSDLRDNSPRELTSLDGADVNALCGVGNPDGFIKTLYSLNANVRGVFSYRDHINYDEQFLMKLPDTGHPFVVTEKDGVKIAPLLQKLAAAGTPCKHAFLQVRITFDIAQNESAIWTRVTESLQM